MKSNEIKFIMDTDWIFKGIIDLEQKEYVLLGYFQKLNKTLEELKLYPMFTEISIHLGNMRTMSKESKILSLNRKLKGYDDELEFKDLTYTEFPILDEKQKIELKKILEYSSPKIQDYFDIVKSFWTIVYDSVNIKLIKNKSNLKSKKGNFFYKKGNTVIIWEYTIRKVKTSTKTTINKIYEGDEQQKDEYLQTKNPIFEVTSSRELPMDETLVPIFKRKVISYVMMTKNLTIS